MRLSHVIIGAILIVLRKPIWIFGVAEEWWEAAWGGRRRLGEIAWQAEASGVSIQRHRKRPFIVVVIILETSGCNLSVIRRFHPRRARLVVKNLEAPN